MVTLIYIFICGLVLAFMDTLAHHFSTSIFRNWSEQFFDTSISHLNKYVGGEVKNGRRKFLKYFPIPVFLTDGWHFAKSIVILSAFVSVYFYETITTNFLVDLIIYRVWFGLVFTLFYSYIFKSKKS